ncbi:hypothetical protein BuS5_02341 [Desulfosarcina sp. BuS5]|uniref:hypothetical protein n=1 Tax=Desulfosarcina sp. BuS5 TaxID=933262 RepID=UPI000483CA1F|nr:hypothetical protein [Desulfosarcina sp. BuS5]WDN89373.1 hypothetical protein BuS5_02341 [Desulfosarcina sp. BuS5]
MKGMKAKRVRFKIGSLWESPALHILLTEENDVVVARCLDFTVSSHGKDDKDALKALADSIKEYVLTAVEHDAVNTIFDPAHGKYWRMYNELETKQSSKSLEMSIKKSLMSIPNDNLQQSTAEINYA